MQAAAEADAHRPVRHAETRRDLGPRQAAQIVQPQRQSVAARQRHQRLTKLPSLDRVESWQHHGETLHRLAGRTFVPTTTRPRRRARPVLRDRPQPRRECAFVATQRGHTGERCDRDVLHDVLGELGSRRALCDTPHTAFVLGPEPREGASAAAARSLHEPSSHFVVVAHPTRAYAPGRRARPSIPEDAPCNEPSRQTSCPWSPCHDRTADREGIR
jgi:hypothetical protein